MGLWAILVTNVWCFRVQRTFEDAVKQQDRQTVQDIMVEGITRTLRGSLSRRQRAELEEPTREHGSTVNEHLTAAFQRGLDRDPRVPCNLSNALDEVFRMAADIAKAQRSVNATLPRAGTR